uniref:Immunoglobulin V-set domain-containing protein n=1 Tax=Poecilia latipinna TaxID=48699 RepID=A0A3B3VEZ0_9TELE
RDQRCGAFRNCSSLSLSCVRSAAGLIRVFGYEGTDVKVSCSYPEGYESYQKYLCRNDCDYSDVLITTSQTNKPRHSIYDDKRTRTFTTTISNLQSTDAGKYWCGVTRNGKDLYTEVKLETKQGFSRIPLFFISIHLCMNSDPFPLNLLPECMPTA